MLIELKNAYISVEDTPLLSKVNFHVDESEFIYIIGKVGSGKSSLLKALFCEHPLSADVAKVLSYDLLKIKRKHIQELRRQIGIVFQDFQLLTDRTVRNNLDFVLRATGWKKKKEREQRIAEVLNEVGLPEKIDAYPHELSGGEQQRIAIARALLNSPQLILADEPTGNLDYDTSRHILQLLKSVCDKGTAVVMITHNLNLLRQFPGIVYRCEDHHLTEITEQFNTPTATRPLPLIYRSNKDTLLERKQNFNSEL